MLVSDRFCNFMHLSHPSLDLVKSLEHSQRLERRKASSAPAPAPSDPNGAAPAIQGEDNGALGWVPGRMATGGAPPGDAGWVPPAAAGDEGGWEGDSWKPSY